MVVYHSKINVESKGENDIIDITNKIQESINSSNLTNGICCVFVPGSTGTISTIEYEPGLKEDFPKALDKIAPKNQNYAHHEKWHDDNGRCHWVYMMRYYSPTNSTIIFLFLGLVSNSININCCHVPWIILLF